MDPEPAGTSADDAVDVRYALSTRDLFEPATTGSRHSVMAGAFGFMMIPGTVFGILQGDPFTVAFGALALGFVTGVIPGALTMFMAGRRPDILTMEQRVVIDAAGVKMSSERASSTATWAMFKRVRETVTAFLLDFGTGAMTFVPKRALDVEQRAAVRQIAAREGKLDRRSSWFWPAVGTGLGGIVTILILALTL
jgi:hypothetical protein